MPPWVADISFRLSHQKLPTRKLSFPLVFDDQQFQHTRAVSRRSPGASPCGLERVSTAGTWPQVLEPAFFVCSNPLFLIFPRDAFVVTLLRPLFPPENPHLPAPSVRRRSPLPSGPANQRLISTSSEVVHGAFVADWPK